MLLGQGPPHPSACPGMGGTSGGGQRGSGSQSPGEPAAPCVRDAGRGPRGCWGPLRFGEWVATGARPYPGVGLRKGGGAALATSCTASSPRVTDLLEAGETPCRHLRIEPFICAPGPASLLYLLEAEIGSTRLCATHLPARVRPARGPRTLNR